MGHDNNEAEITDELWNFYVVYDEMWCQWTSNETVG